MSQRASHAGVPRVLNRAPHLVESDYDDDYSSREVSVHDSNPHTTVFPSDVNFVRADTSHTITTARPLSSSDSMSAPQTMSHVSSATSGENRSSHRSMVQIISARSTPAQQQQQQQQASVPTPTSTTIAATTTTTTSNMQPILSASNTAAHAHVHNGSGRHRNATSRHPTRPSTSIQVHQDQHRHDSVSVDGDLNDLNVHNLSHLVQSPSLPHNFPNDTESHAEYAPPADQNMHDNTPIIQGGHDTVEAVSITMSPTHELNRTELAYFGIKPLPDIVLQQLSIPANYHTATQVFLLVMFSLGLAYAYTMGLLIFFSLYIFLFTLILIMFHFGFVSHFLHCFCGSSTINKRADEFLLSNAYYLWQQFFFVLLQLVSMICSTCVLFSVPLVLQSTTSTTHNVLDAIRALNGEGIPLFCVTIILTFLNILTFLWYFFTLQQVSSQLQYAHMTSPAKLAEHQASLEVDPLVGVVRVSNEEDDLSIDGLSPHERVLATSAMVIFKQLMGRRDLTCEQI